MSSQIKTKTGEICIVDDEDYERLSKMKWHIKGVYPASRVKSDHLYMHQWVIGKAPDGLVTDHINRNRFDNRKSNLRFITQSENVRNRRAFGSSSKYRGVYKHVNKDRWAAQTMYEGKHVYIGIFKSEIEAALAYNKKVLELFGDKAYINEGI